MLELALRFPADQSATVLCIGAHCDDIEIGCGGTLLNLAMSHADLRVIWVVFSGEELRKDEIRDSARTFLGEQHRIHLIEESFADGRLPYDPLPVKEAMERIRSSVSPDLIFTHWRNDAHQDHRFVSELTWNTFRNHLILEYEIPKFDGDLGQPNAYCSLDRAVAERKADHLLKTYRSQSGRKWFDRELFLGLMRLRGMECQSHSGFAEAFHAHKLSVTV